ncbi:glycosyltransferase [Flavobacterium croceum]|uniref:glycosyltransferase n=1 Tax=Flavobacterium croceum TaxID=370975 RepID=UPI0031F4E5E2
MKRKILILSAVNIEPNSSAAGGRMLQLLNLFQEMDFEIHYATTAVKTEFSVNIPYVSFHNIVINDSSFDNFVANLNPTVVVFDRFMLEEQFGSKISENCPNALKILDTEDLHSLRQARQNCVKTQTPFTLDTWKNNDYTKREIASIYRCDVTLIISEYEYHCLVHDFKIPESILFYIPLFAKKQENIKNFSERTDFAFIGNFLHEPNWDATQQLYKTIWPSIKQKLPRAKMKIYGAYPTQKVLELHQPGKGFYIQGRVDNALEAIASAKVLLAPIRFGAGIKGKLLDAMQTGTPSITTKIGAEGMEYKGWNGFVCDDNKSFIEKSILLYSDEKLWHTMQEKGFEIIEKKLNSLFFADAFKEKINRMIDDLAYYRNDNYIGKLLNHHTTNAYYYMNKWIEEKNKKLQ